MNDLTIRLATKDDCRTVFEWRNHEQTRIMSNKVDKIDWNKHKIWFNESIKRKSRMLLICEQGSKNQIATVRFDIINTVALVSINLKPSMRGKKLAKPCLKLSIDFFLSKCKSVKFLIAEIKEINIASRKLFVGAGFNLIKVEKKIGLYKKNLILNNSHATFF